MLYSAITKNLKWKFLTKNLVSFRKWDGVENEYIEGEFPKKYG